MHFWCQLIVNLRFFFQLAFSSSLVCDALQVLNPIGGTVANPNSGTSITLHLELDRYTGGMVMYPSLRQIEQYANSLIGRGSSATPQGPVLEHLHRIVEMDSLGELDDQEQEVVWQYRDYLLAIPQSLPKLLRSVKWSSRDAVARMLQVRYVRLDCVLLVVDITGRMPVLLHH